MGYSIVESTANSFIDNRNVKLPRFQRKQTWKHQHNFKLAISVFKGYPIGVIIINSVSHPEKVDWLLDGRQRRNALKLMRDNPVEIYHWAKKFSSFKYSCSEEELKNEFWTKIDIYLQDEFDKNDEKDSNDVDDYDVESDDIQSYDMSEQYSSLKALLDLVCIVHPYKKGQTRFENMFMFNNLIDIKDLDYHAIQEGKYVIDVEKLVKFINYYAQTEIVEEATFFNYLDKRFRLTEKSRDALKKYISLHWNYYHSCFETIRKTQSVVQEATIGMIKLTNATVLDAQNIFSLVNSGGTPLTSEELLSARPFWNIEISTPSLNLQREVESMYKQLEIDKPNTVTRWDVGATIINRLDSQNIIFSDMSLSNGGLKTSMSLGFRLLSAIYTQGISQTKVMELEKVKINWDVEIESLINDLNTMVELLMNIEYFKYLKRWNQSLMSITSNTIAIEFIVILYKIWNDYGKPLKASKKIKLFEGDALRFIDRLIYEYTMRFWVGSSDSKLAYDYISYKTRVDAISKDNWKKLVNDLSEGVLNGKSTKPDTLKGFIYHYYLIKGMLPEPEKLDTIYEIDHIYAQKIFTDNKIEKSLYKDNIINLALFPKGDNIDKSNKRLNEINNQWLKKQIATYTGIEEDQFDFYSDITNLEDLKKLRLKMYLDVFDAKRDALLNNI